MPADCLASGSQSSGRQLPAGNLKAEVSTATGGPPGSRRRAHVLGFSLGAWRGLGAFAGLCGSGPQLRPGGDNRLQLQPGEIRYSDCL